MERFIGFRRDNMNIKIFRAYVELCRTWDKPIAWSGLHNFRMVFK